MKTGVAGAVAAVLLFGTTIAYAQVVNGGFEMPNVSATGYQQFNAVSAGIPGWSVTAGSVDVVDQGFFAPVQGTQTLDLDGLGPGTIAQSFATIVGTQYSLDFAYSDNPFPGGPAPTHSANVSVTGTGTLLNTIVSHNTSTGPSLAQMDYQLFHSLFVADSTTTMLIFASLDPAGQNAGIVLDDIRVTAAPSVATPEFGSVFSLGGLLAAGGAGLWVRRRRAK